MVSFQIVSLHNIKPKGIEKVKILIGVVIKRTLKQ